jgi:hypothetical protein
VSREQRSAADLVVQVLGDGPGQRHAVVRARAPADLIGLPSNPFEDLGAFEDLLLVMRAGEAVVAIDG